LGGEKLFQFVDSDNKESDINVAAAAVIPMQLSPAGCIFPVDFFLFPAFGPDFKPPKSTNKRGAPEQ